MNSKPSLTKEQILSTGDWYEADYIGAMEGFYWKHKSILEDDYAFYMRRYRDDGYTTITEEGKGEQVLFRGYIKNCEDLKMIINLCRLREI